mmetsp:Transcript_6400/g.16305  ORF Transcript_6400/g.16305 Transcript_6400/m.16305 type:complete len:236 (-) Transcript_6400:744-1451(-)
MKGRADLCAVPLDRGATEQVADDADEAAEWLGVRQEGIEGRAAPLRLAPQDDSMIAPTELLNFLLDEGVQSSLHSGQGLPINGILLGSIVVGEVVIPRQELGQVPPLAGLVPPTIEATHLSTGRRGYHDFQLDRTVKEVMGPVCIVSQSRTAEPMQVDHRPLLGAAGVSEHHRRQKVQGALLNDDALPRVQGLLAARGRGDDHGLTSQGAFGIAPAALLHARDEWVAPEGALHLH